MFGADPYLLDKQNQTVIWVQVSTDFIAATIFLLATEK